MAHRALTLKYRPQVFADLVGQEHASRVLARALEGNRAAHAYLFTGARGVGKTTSARILAKALNCEKRRSGQVTGADPCNACTSCLEITSGVSLDVAEIDGASNRGIADVQALREKVRFAPTGGHHRVVIIDEVHQLSGDAFAALLKTLEEPPAHLVFIFATTDPQKVPDTIRSRTQRFDFARVPLRRVADRLIEIQKREAADPEGTRFTLTEGAALLLAHKSEGSMRDAVSALDQAVSAGEPEVNEELVRRVLGIPDREVFFRIAEAVLGRDPKAALHAVHEAFDRGLDPKDLADGLAEHIRHVLIVKVDPKGAAELVPVAREDLERLRAQSERWSDGDLLRLLKLVTESVWPMRESAQPLVHLEAAVLQMATLEPGETLVELIARLEALEHRLAGGPAPRGGTPAPGGARGGTGAGASGAATVAGAGSGRPGYSAATSGVAAGGHAGPGHGSPSAPRPGTGSAPSAFAASATTPRPAAGSAPVGTPAPPPAPRPATGSAPVGAPASASAPRSATLPGTIHASGDTPPARPAPAAAGSGAPRASAAAASSPTPPIAVPARRGIDPVAARIAAAAVAELDLVCDGEAEGCWRAAIAAVNGRKRMLGAFLEEARFIGVANEWLVLAMDHLHRTVVEEKDNHAILAEAVRAAFGRPLLVRCTAGDAPPAPRPPGLADVAPMVERAIEWFEGDVIDPRRGSERTNGA